MSCNFSTSGAFEKMASEVVLMSQCQKYFNYVMMFGGCGLTKVHFLGTLEDWMNLKEKVKKMGEYDEPLREWSILLLKILDKFTEALKGKVDRVFWN